jgi:predicted enzyme related to lactoylglutathione lyase
MQRHRVSHDYVPIASIQTSLRQAMPSTDGAAWRRNLFVATLAAMMAMPAFALPVTLPALVSPANQEHHTGKVVFVELVTPDLARAKQFYGELFGWTFRDTQSGNFVYTEASLYGRPVAGLMQKSIPPGEHRQPAWLTFIASADVDAVKNTALQHGAKLLLAPRNVPDRGREAIFSDPQGAVFAVLASTSGDPADVLAVSGEWIWSSLITTDPDAAAAFYQSLFDYEVFELPASPGAEHLMLASDNYARASANSLPMERAITPPYWLNYVRVDNVTKMAEKAIASGGKVLVEPRIDRHGGKVAVVSDPSGATFGLIEWPDTESKEVGK